MNTVEKPENDYQRLKQEYENLVAKNQHYESVFSKLDLMKLLVAGLICLVFLATALCLKRTTTVFSLQKTAHTDKEIIETYAVAQLDTMSMEIRIAGLIEPHNKITLAAQTSGRVVQRKFNEGDYVQQNQILYQMDTKELAKDVRSARIAFIELLEQYNNLTKWDSSLVVKQAERKFELSKISLNNEKKKLEETKKLFEKGIIPRVEYEQALTTFKKAQYDYEDSKQALETELEKGNPQKLEVLRLKLSNAKDELDEIEARYEATLIRAPLSGIIMLPESSTGQKGSFKNEGDMVNDGDLVATIGATDSYIIRSKVGELSVKHLQVGQDVLITGPSLGNVTLKGQVDWIASEASLEENMRYFPIRIIIPGVSDAVRDKIRLGTFVQAVIRVQEFENVITVPIQGVTFSKGKSSVFVVDESGDIQERQVKVGYSDRQKVIISEGLDEGETIVIKTIRNL